MADPLMNEMGILATIDPQVALNTDGIRSAFAIMVVACYDRKVEREFFTEMFDMALEAHTITGKLECAAITRQVYKKHQPEEEPALLDAAIAENVKKLHKLRERAAEKFALVTICPTSRDKIN